MTSRHPNGSAPRMLGSVRNPEKPNRRALSAEIL